MPSAGRPRWQQMAALVSLSAGGAITGFSFVPKAAADFSSPTSLPLNLVALRQAVQPPQAERQAPGHDAMLRAAIVHVADYYLRMAQTKTPAEMEAMIWQHDSIDGADHGQSCAAFASLTLELGAQVVGHQSWVSGGCLVPVAPAHLGRRAGGGEPGVARRSRPSSRTRRPISAGIRWGTGTGPCRATGCCSMATSRWSPRTPAGCCTPWAGIRCPTSRSTRTNTRRRWRPRAWSGS